ncbi:MAG: L-threonylcarbamoyladenylate synthase [Pelagibacterales bacterium]|nr:L-threonylcarbamoyladenylate synthase [Pelagibacterales bacterium]
MKNIYLNIHKFNNKNLNKAVNILKKNDLVGVPTETVYGLAGNAYSKSSIKKIFGLKKRPKINPLIIHYLDIKRIVNDVQLNEKFIKLYKTFCPGPITFILKKKNSSKIPKLATANLNTIAIRFPDNRILRKILKKINMPLAIPSANISSGISPVNAKDVVDEFKEKIKFVINGGPSKIGLESTVVDLTGKPKILRPGVISPKKIGKVLKSKISIFKSFKKIKSPGSIKKHYSPGIPMKLNQKKTLINCAFIILGKKYKKTKNTFNLSEKSNLNEAAKNLYKVFRKIKKKKYKIIHVVKIPNKGIGIAINDRLKHASN